MLRTTLITGATVLSAALATTAASAQPQTGYAAVNGLEMYYEIHGTGEPLVVLHGGLATIDLMRGALLDGLAAGRQVIAVEFQAHGHTADIDRPLTYDGLADDVAALVASLGLGQVDVLGYSMGGTVALDVAIRHPEIVDRLVLISSPYALDGMAPANIAGMAMMNANVLRGTPLEQIYLATAPRPEDFATLVGKVSQLTSQPVYLDPAAVATITAPTLIIVGDSDAVLPQHALDLFHLLGGGAGGGGENGLGATTPTELAILPATTHFGIMMRADLLLPLIGPFLDGTPPAPAAP
jgi:pimeloyl-ACP methyl ester carboxylesterase